MEIQVPIRSGRWLRAGEEAIVRHLAHVVYGSDEGVGQQTHGYKWSLRTSANDWWASALKDGEITVAYRYGTDDMMKGLQTFLVWVFG